MTFNISYSNRTLMQMAGQKMAGEGLARKRNKNSRKGAKTQRKRKEKTHLNLPLTFADEYSSSLKPHA